MLLKSALLVLATLCCFSSHVSAIRFKGNISVSANGNGNGHGWDYRKSYLIVIPEANFLTYTSVDVERSNLGHGNKQFNVSAISGGGIFAPGQIPYAYLASGTESGSIYKGNKVNTTDFSASLGYVSTAYLRIEEKDSNGTIVDSSSLRGFDLNGGVQWKLGYTNDDGTLSQASFVGTPQDGSAWTINITFIASSVIGVIDLANAVVGPSSLEQVVQINNYQYQAPDNYLSLVMYTASGSVTASSSSSITTLTSGSDSTQVYFSASGSAVVDGKFKTVNVKVDAAASTDADIQKLNGNFIQQVLSKFGASTSFHKVTVDFSAGAEAITYDPSQGAGSQLPASGSSSSQSSSSSSVVASFSFLLLALVALLL